MGNANRKTKRQPALGRMPLELVECIIWQLNIQDARNFYHAIKYSKKHSDVTMHVLSRLSVADYINSNLGDSNVILKSMSLNLVYLSGSGALEFFKPGVRGPQSDWDFYAPNDLALVSASMKDMEKVGVKWRSPLDQIIKYMNEGGGTVRMHKKLLNEVFRDGSLWEAVSRKNFQLHASPVVLLVHDRDLQSYCMLKEKIDLFLGSKYTFYDVKVNTEANYVMIDQRLYSPYENISSIQSVIRGELRRANKTVEIQLMVEARDHLFDTPSVFSFHSSAVQCYIGGHVACHYYGVSALKVINYVWTDLIKTEKNRKAVQKYEARGFRSVRIRPSFHREYSKVGVGKQAIFLGAYNFTDREDKIKRAFGELARETRWKERHSGTTLIERTSFGDWAYWTWGYVRDPYFVEHTKLLSPHIVAQQWVVCTQ